MTKKTQVERGAWTACMVLILLAYGGCKEQEMPVPPPPKVTVAQPVQKEVTLHWEFTGNTEAVAQVEVRARVEGYLQNVAFEDGDLVEEGDLLFVIEPDPYDVKVDQARAQLTARQAELAQAEADLGRVQQAAETNAVSKQQVDQTRAQRDVARASVEQAEAALAEAKLNLGYTKVHSPISGRVSESYVDVGNLVGSAERTLLATVVTVDPIYVYFNVSERVLAAKLEELSVLGAEGRQRKPNMPCFVGLPGDDGYPFAGAVDYADITVEAGTGTIQIRAGVPNEALRLYPGMFVRIRVARETREEAVLVSERALGTDLAGKYLLVVGKDNVVERRGVQIGALIEGMRVIEAGITADERYVVSGLQRARPGLPVTPQPARPTPPEVPAGERHSEAGEGGGDV
ncbi:MAG: efflux RND transporter periplasmic adaptor subunit [Planctomycetota bacterium]